MGVIKKNVVWTTDNFGREYPIYDSRVVVADPSPTPTPSVTPTITPTPSVTPTSTPAATPTPTPSPSVTYDYWNVFECNDPFGPTFVVRTTIALTTGNSVKVVGDDITCYEVTTKGAPPYDYDVSASFGDCVECQTS